MNLHGNRKNDKPDFQPAPETFQKGAGDPGYYRSKRECAGLYSVESEKHNVYQKEIEKEFDLRPSTATEVLKHLEEEDLIVRVPDEEDGRLKKIVFTEKAKAIRSALRSEIEQSEEVLLRGISREEQAVFMKITAKMLENLEEEEKRNE